MVPSDSFLKVLPLYYDSQLLAVYFVREINDPRPILKTQNFKVDEIGHGFFSQENKKAPPRLC